MDNKTRAEKILLLCQLPTTDSAYADSRNGLPCHLKKDIIFQLDEAAMEALENMAWGNLEKLAYEKGFSSAREMAAGVCDSIWENNKNCDPEAGILLDKSINAIRSMKMDEKK